MYHEVGLDALSKKQVSRLLNGHPVRVKFGSGIKAIVSAEHLKKISKAGLKGMGSTLRLDPYAIAHNQYLRKAVGMLGRGKGHDLAGVLSDSSGRSAIAATDRLVRALEGSGTTDTITKTISPLLNQYTTPAQKAMLKQQAKEVIHGLGVKKGKGKGHKLAGILADSAGRSAVAATDRLVRALEGSGAAKKKICGRGKKSSTDQFRDWTKNIGQVFKPLNRGALGAAKRQVIGAAGNAISDEISNQGNPFIDGAELFSQGMAGMDGDPSTQGINLGSDVPVQQTRYQMRKAKIAARPPPRPVGATPLPYSYAEPVYATPITPRARASPATSKSLGLPPLPDGSYDDSYSIPVGQLYGVGVKKDVAKIVKMVKIIEGGKAKPKRVPSQKQLAALAKGRHALMIKMQGGAQKPGGY